MVYLRPPAAGRPPAPCPMRASHLRQTHSVNDVGVISGCSNVSCTWCTGGHRQRGDHLHHAQCAPPTCSRCITSQYSTSHYINGVGLVTGCSKVSCAWCICGHLQRAGRVCHAQCAPPTCSRCTVNFGMLCMGLSSVHDVELISVCTTRATPNARLPPAADAQLACYMLPWGDLQCVINVGLISECSDFSCTWCTGNSRQPAAARAMRASHLQQTRTLGCSSVLVLQCGSAMNRYVSCASAWCTLASGVNRRAVRVFVGRGCAAALLRLLHSAAAHQHKLHSSRQQQCALLHAAATTVASPTAGSCNAAAAAAVAPPPALGMLGDAPEGAAGAGGATRLPAQRRNQVVTTHLQQQQQSVKTIDLGNSKLERC
jgi:hypothetical protein